METEYKELIERVRLIDPAAAEYLEGDDVRKRNFLPHENLSSVMVWSETPQGHRYWSNIDSALAKTPPPDWKSREQGRMDNGIYEPVNLAGDDPDRFLHVSLLNPDMVAYTKNAEKGQADIQTKTTLEKYIRKFGLSCGRESRDALDETELKEELKEALTIIIGEYPKEDERYVWAHEIARRFNIDTREM